MPADCCKKFWENIADDVPVFTLVGTDPLAASTVDYWLAQARVSNVNQGKINRAALHASAMRDFLENHPERMKIPD